MKKIFIVDDDNYKIQNIQALLSSVNEKYSISISHALNPALRKLHDEEFDLILLDMSMPVFDLSETRNFDSFGGITFLREMKRKKIGIPTIVITQYEIFGEGESQKTSESIDEMCRQTFMNYKGLIVYSSADRSWKEKLVKMLGEL